MIKPVIAHLGLGSNLGNRLGYLSEALRLLADVLKIEAIASVYETEPWGMKDQPWFLNTVCRVNTVLDPVPLLHVVKNIEHAMGRGGIIPGGPRIIDIDVLLYGDLVLDTPQLIVPHPHLHERSFVLVPLTEISCSINHPKLGVNIDELVKRTLNQTDIRKWGPPVVVGPEEISG